MGIRLWPPARILASGAYLDSSVRACATLVARSYSTCAGTCTFTSPLTGNARLVHYMQPMPYVIF